MAPANIAIMRKIVLGYRKMELSELFNIIGIWKKRVGHIVHAFLQMKNFVSDECSVPSFPDSPQKWLSGKKFYSNVEINGWE